MAKIVITGATGFIGSNVCKRLLNCGHDLSIICRSTSKFDNILSIKNKLDIFIYDGNTSNLVEYFKKMKFDLVIHLATSYGVENEVEGVKDVIDTNITFSTQILCAMKDSNCKKIINTSTYWQHYNNEEYNPTSLYAATKEAFENIMKFYAESCSIKCITLELFDTYGEGDTRPKILNILGKYSDGKVELDMSKGEQILDLLHIDDVVDAYIEAMDIIDNKNDNELDKYSLESENRINLKDLVKLYENITNRKISINWGSRPYREREIMIPWNKGNKLPGWESKIDLEAGIKRVFG